MKKLLLVCVGLLAIACAASLNLLRDLRAKEQENAGLRTQLVQAMALARQPAAPAPPVAPARLSASTPVQPDPLRGASPTATTNQQAPLAIGATISALALGAGNDRELMKDAEFRKARITQMRIQMERNNSGVAEALGLSRQEADQLFELLAENQLKMSTELTARIAANTQGARGGQIASDVAQWQSAMQREQEESIRALLGNGRYDQWQAYQQARPARNQVATMGSQLAAAGVPLTDAQSRALTTVLVSEQQRQIQPQAPVVTSAQSLRAVSQELEARIAENSRRALDAAAPHLSAAQLAVLRDQLEQQFTPRRDAMGRGQDVGPNVGPNVGQMMQQLTPGSLQTR